MVQEVCGFKGLFLYLVPAMNNRGIIIQSTGKWYKVAVGDKTIDCRLPGRFRLKREEVTNPVAVGDVVEIMYENEQTATITDVKERVNYFPRKATHGRRGEQVLIANVDIAWVVLSVRKPKFKTGLIDRFLVTCEAYDITPGIIINKTDLAGRQDLNELNAMNELYSGLGYTLLLTSVHDTASTDALLNALKNRTSVFIGPSGTGKTSLLNVLSPDSHLPVAEVSSSSDKGKHTTTFARLVPAGSGSFIADTPGIRELGLVNISPPELSLYFPEMAEFRQECKFYNCTHSHEPGCEVMEAYSRGEIHPERYNSYLNILSSLEATAH